MSIENTPNNHELLDTVAKLCSNGESGRLQIMAGATRGAFFFKNGKLVDARMGRFTGFPAVNLAVSMRVASLSFDPSIPPPASVFDLLGERLVLKERFGIETVDSRSAGNPSSLAEVAESAFISSQRAPLPEVSFPEKAASSEQKEEIIRVPGRPSFSYSTRKNMFVRTGAILLIIVPAAVGIASYWSPRRATAPQDVSLVPPAPALSTPVLTPTVLQDDDRKIVAAPVKEPQPALEPAAVEDIPPLESEETKSPQAEGPRPDTQAVPDSASAGGAPGEESTLKPLSRAIAVVVEINEGRVTEAYIQNRQAGLWSEPQK